MCRLNEIYGPVTSARIALAQLQGTPSEHQARTALQRAVRRANAQLAQLGKAPIRDSQKGVRLCNFQ